MKFIIADASGDMATVLYNDLRDESKYFILNKAKLYKNKLLNVICRVNISINQNMKKKMFLKMFFYRRLFGNFNPDEQLCFYFGTAWYDPELLCYLRKKYPQAKFVLNFHDTVESKIKRFNNMSVEQLKKEFDLIYTYSEVDQKKYGFEYTPDMYSKLEISQLPTVPQADVVFIGAAKDRLQMICQIYKRLSDEGLNCWFYVVGAKEEEKQYKNEIIYAEKFLPFLEVIARQVNAKCILEITQAGCEDATLRFWDAVMYNKKIITNCLAVKKYDYYCDKMVCVFENISDIDAAFVSEEITCDYKYKGDISPICVFNSIERKLRELDENRAN